MPDNLIRCEGCGAIRGKDNAIPVPSHCDECPPWRCASCGQMDSMAVPCACWTSLEGVPMADIKALFARDGGFQLDHDITGGSHA